MKQIKIISISSLVLSLAMLGFMITKFTSAAITDGHFVHSCVKNSSGSVRIVEASDTCAGNETALKWNSDGINDFGGFTTKELVSIDLGDQSISYRNFKDANFSSAGFLRTRMLYGNFKNSNFTGASFNETDAIGSDFTNANFTNVIFAGARFAEVNFMNVNLTNASFTNVNLHGALNVDTTSRIGVIWSNTICPDTTNSDNNGNTCEGHLVP